MFTFLQDAIIDKTMRINLREVKVNILELKKKYNIKRRAKWTEKTVAT
jgi:hypothetical protein